MTDNDNKYGRDHVPYFDRNKISSEELNENERAFLFKLNKKLTFLEKRFKPEIEKISKECRKRLADKNDFVKDYEIEWNITYYVKESDPDYLEDDDNILYEEHVLFLEEYLKDDMIDDGENHNEFQGWDDHPMKDEFHCFLYHCLYDHSHLGWANILRIDSLWVDIIVTYQYFEDI